MGEEGGVPSDCPLVHPVGLDESRGVPLKADEATRYRAMVAHCNFLGCDRLDIQFAAKEASRWMAQPCEGDIEHITRIGKCLNGEMGQIFPSGEDDYRARLLRFGLGWVHAHSKVHVVACCV